MRERWFWGWDVYPRGRQAGRQLRGGLPDPDGYSHNGTLGTKTPDPEEAARNRAGERPNE